MISKCEFLSGWLSGVVGLIVGHPLDTIKVRIQTSADRSVMSNLRSTYRHEGFHGFFKGIIIPVMAAGALNAIYFGVYGNCLRYFTGQNRTLCCEDHPIPHSADPDRMWHVKVALAGFLGGVANVLVGCPVDCVKTKQQGNRKSLSSPFTLARQLLKSQGIRGLYCGFVPMMCRDGPGFSLYIITYEHVLCTMEGELPFGGGKRKIVSEIFSGGIAGSVSWLIGMPFDVVKSRLQLDDPKRPKYKGMVDCIRQSKRNEGYLIFYKGLTAALLRSFPVNATTFVVYQFSMRKCKDWKPSEKYKDVA